MITKLQKERILAGKCPLCGEEAAPYRLCHEHRMKQRFGTAIRRGVKFGALQKTEDNKIWKGEHFDDPYKKGKWGSSCLYPKQGDKRADPRLRKMRVDVEKTIIEVMNYINRPCTIEEISGVWGKLRADRSSPLANDLGRLIIAQDRRARRMAKAVAIAARTQDGESF